MLTVAPIEEGQNQLPLPTRRSSASQYLANRVWMLRVQLQGARRGADFTFTAIG